MLCHVMLYYSISYNSLQAAEDGAERVGARGAWVDYYTYDWNNHVNINIVYIYIYIERERDMNISII